MEAGGEGARRSKSGEEKRRTVPVSEKGGARRTTGAAKAYSVGARNYKVRTVETQEKKAVSTGAPRKLTPEEVRARNERLRQKRVMEARANNTARNSQGARKVPVRQGGASGNARRTGKRGRDEIGMVRKEDLFDEEVPFYKKWWVWAIAAGVLILLVLILLITRGNGGSDKSTVQIDNTEAAKAQAQKDDTATTEKSKQTTVEEENAKAAAEAKKKAEEEAQAEKEKQAEEEAKKKKAEEEEAKKAELQTTAKNNEALAAAKAYISSAVYSYNGLTMKLQSDGYTSDEAAYAAKNVGANWNEQATKKAKQYISSNAKITEDELETKLRADGFTEAQTIYAIDNCGVDWEEEEETTADKKTSEKDETD